MLAGKAMGTIDVHDRRVTSSGMKTPVMMHVPESRRSTFDMDNN